MLFRDWARLPWYLLASRCLFGSGSDERKHRFHWWLIFLSMSMSGWERGGIMHIKQAFSRNMLSNARPSGWKICRTFSLGTAEWFLDFLSTCNRGYLGFFCFFSITRFPIWGNEVTSINGHNVNQLLVSKEIENCNVYMDHFCILKWWIELLLNISLTIRWVSYICVAIS